MGLREQLEAEAEERTKVFVSRADPTRCLSCGSRGAPRLLSSEFRWRKQVGANQHHHVRVEHSSTHPLCSACLQQLRYRRRWFWPIRYAGGTALAAGICGVVTVPILLWCLHLNADEHREVISTGIVSLVLLVAGIWTLGYARHLSVPPTLLDMTGRGWECVSVRELAEDAAPLR